MRAETVQQTLASFFRPNFFQGVEYRVVCFRIARDHGPVIIVADMRKEVATAWDNEGIPAEYKAWKNKGCKFDDRTVTEPVSRCGFNRAILSETATHHLHHGPPCFFELWAADVREGNPQ